MRYLKHDKTTVTSTVATSITRKPDREVTEEYVRNYVEAVDFFESLEGTETVHKRQGRISVTSISPDRSTVREVVFVPIVEGPSL